jgi:predicted ATPase/DNA-binding winged helix-turn-helix (wHTH) protein
MPEQAAQAGVVLSFGRFELSPSKRLLTENGAPVELGARTLDTLIALVSRPNEVLGKRELMALVWPDVTVEEASLRFHIAGLRKALGDGQNGARYVATLAGRGYCFVAPVNRSGNPGEAAAAEQAVAPRATFLPPRLARMVGRDDSVRAIVAELTASRFVTVVGPGGVGKTTVAVAVAHTLLPAFGGAMLFVDFGLLSDSRMVPVSVASMLGLSIQSEDPVPSLITLLRNRRMLLVLDNCEHVIEDAAGFAARLFLAAPGLQILATSREPLRVEGEQVHRLAPLGVPPEDSTLSADFTLNFPATRLFVERATAGGARLDLGETNAAIVAAICRKLDGMALAIELAAGRVEAYGLRQIAALLDERFALLWPGQRTAPARQKTLRATLDWSYGLLSDAERLVFRRLAVFVGAFSIEAALAVVTSETIDAAWVFAAIDSLVAKSMVTAVPIGAMMRYRLLDTARAYALDFSADHSERTELASRHAAYCVSWLRQFEADGPPLSDAAERAAQLLGLANVRAALEWCFGANGDARLGVRLAASAVPAFLALSLLTECHHWSRRALLALDDTSRRGAEEMQLQAALGLSSMFTRGHGEEAQSALQKALEIAGERDDNVRQLTFLSVLHMFHHRACDTRMALSCARRSSIVASTIEAPGPVALARTQLGISLTLAGDLSGAQVELEAALRQPEIFLQGFDYRAIASGYLARVRWLRGYPSRAAGDIRLNVRNAAQAAAPVSLTFALTFAVPLLLWLGDLGGAEEHLEWLVSHAESRSLQLPLAVARGFKGQLAISRGHVRSGLEMLEASLRDLIAAKYNVWITPFNISRCQALFRIGRSTDAIALIDDTLRHTEDNGDLTYIPELLRLKAEVLSGVNPPGLDVAEMCLMDSLEWSRRQGARASELRAAIDLAAMRARQERMAEAGAVLRPVFAEFTEGFETTDLKAAERLLVTLG